MRASQRMIHCYLDAFETSTRSTEVFHRIMDILSIHIIRLVCGKATLLCHTGKYIRHFYIPKIK